MSSYSEGQTHQLANALEAKGFTPEEITQLGQYKQLGDIRLLLNGQAQIVVINQEETSLNTTIRVDRLVRPVYPAWVGVVMHPELESTGPAEYDLATSVSLWLHDKQKRGTTTGQVIYDHLKERDMLASCLSLYDAVEIQKKGVAVFRQVFGAINIYFWKSVLEDRSPRHLRVPYLYVHDGKVVLDWHWLAGGLSDNEPAVRFAS